MVPFTKLEEMIDVAHIPEAGWVVGKSWKQVTTKDVCEKKERGTVYEGEHTVHTVTL